MARALKVYRTAIGFHDAYVAAPTKKAALEAWGADRNLFASGRAELVEDPKLTKAPLASPGTVIKVLRGSAAEQFAALGSADRKSRKRPTAKADAGKPVKVAPRPSRKALDRAEANLAATEKRHAQGLEKIAQQEDALRRKRRTLEEERDREVDKLQAGIDGLREHYDHAMRNWRG